MVDSIFIEKISGDDLLDNFLENFLAKVISRDILGVLSGNDDGIDAERDSSTTILFVLDSDLGFGVGTKPGKLTRTTSRSQCSVELVGKRDGQGHVFLGLISGIAKHDTLVTGTHSLK